MGDTSELARLLGARFIQRRDVKTRQWGHGEHAKIPVGGYSPVRARPVGQWSETNKGEHIPWKRSDIIDHLEGHKTYGHYLVDPEGMTRVVAFDVDFDKEFPFEGQILKPREVFGTDHPGAIAMNEAVRCLADALAYRLKWKYPRLTVCTSFSGSKGIHVYGLFAEPTFASTARGTGISVIASMVSLEPSRLGYKPIRESLPLEVEVFPKQEKVGRGGYGNLMRLPLGIHKKTEGPSYFYDPTSDPTTIEPMDPTLAITEGLTLTPKQEYA